MHYRRTIPIEFNHCDPAGIVFYARYFEMTNSVCENFFADLVGRSYARIMAEGDGLPTVRLEAEFRAPSRLGDRLDFALQVTGIGRSSLDVTITAGAEGGGEDRLTVRKRLVWIGPDKRSAPWPDAIRARIEPMLSPAAGGAG